VLLFESNLGWNGSGGVEALDLHRHSNVVNVLLADGAVITISRARLGTLRWEP
jgi:prepilin-type processing-associated H-X9-DG protein